MNKIHHVERLSDSRDLGNESGVLESPSNCTPITQSKCYICFWIAQSYFYVIWVKLLFTDLNHCFFNYLRISDTPLDWPRSRISICITILINHPKKFLSDPSLRTTMKSERSTGKSLLYLVISVILPVALILINHLYRPDNLFLSIFLVAWIGFALLVIQPYHTEGYETVDP